MERQTTRTPHVVPVDGGDRRQRGPSRPAAHADWALAMQRSAGNSAVAGVLARTVKLWSADEQKAVPQSAERLRAIVAAQQLGPDVLPGLDEEIAALVSPTFEKRCRSEEQIFSLVIERLQQRYQAQLMGALARVIALLPEGGIATLVWAHRLAKFPEDIEAVVAQLESLVTEEDMKHQFKDVFSKPDQPFGVKLTAAHRANWLAGKQAQVDGLIAELRVASRTTADQLADSEKMRFGTKFLAPVQTVTTMQPADGGGTSEPTAGTGGRPLKRPPQQLSVKADLSYTDRDGKLWFVEIAEGVDGLRKKVTRLTSHQRTAYQSVAAAQTKPVVLKYVCLKTVGWIKLCNKDHGEPSPVHEMVKGNWILELGTDILSTQQLAQAAANGDLLYAADGLDANTIGRRHHLAWQSMAAFAADSDPVKTFRTKAAVGSQLTQVKETKKDETVLI